MLLTTNEVIKKYQVSRQYIEQLRKGYHQVLKKNGKIYEYNRPPKFTSGIHFIWEEGRVYYSAEALKVYFGK